MCTVTSILLQTYRPSSAQSKMSTNITDNEDWHGWIEWSPAGTPAHVTELEGASLDPNSSTNTSQTIELASFEPVENASSESSRTVESNHARELQDHPIAGIDDNSPGEVQTPVDAMLSLYPRHSSELQKSIGQSRSVRGVQSHARLLAPKMGSALLADTWLQRDNFIHYSPYGPTAQQPRSRTKFDQPNLIMYRANRKAGSCAGCRIRKVTVSDDLLFSNKS